MELSKILIVDDEPAMRTLLHGILGSEPYKLIDAADGQQALALVEREKPDLILLDIMMPGIDGIAVLRQLKAQERTRHIPVVMFTALAGETDVALSLEEGAADHITKPFSPMVLRARIKAALRTRAPAVPESSAPQRSKLIGFIGAKGGTGTTMAVVNTALALVAPQRSVAVVELRSYPGTMAQQFGTTPQLDLQPLLAPPASGTLAQHLENCLTLHPKGLKLLLAPTTFDDQRVISPGQAEEILGTLLGMADFVLADLPFPPCAATRAALKRCDAVVLTVELEATSLASARALLAGFAAWEIDTEAIGALLIVHRPSDGAALTVSQARKDLPCRFVGVIPSAGEVCLVALKTGQPLVLSAPNSAAATAFTEFAARLTAKQVRSVSF